MFRPWLLPSVAARPWRLVPELDGYSDRECLAFVERVARWRVIGLAAALPIAGVVAIGMAGIGPELGERLLGKSHQALDGHTVIGRAVGTAYALVVLACTLTAALTPYCWLLRFGLRARLNRLVCLCGYSVLGLPVIDGRLRCPECGRETELALRGWTEADLLSGARRERAASPEVRRFGWAHGALAAAAGSLLTAYVVTGGMHFVVWAIGLGVVGVFDGCLRRGGNDAGGIATSRSATGRGIR